MPNPDQLPSLIHLLEDESIRVAVMKELASFGASLEDEIERQNIPLSSANAVLLRPLFARHPDWLRRNWPSWFGKKMDNEQLEAALNLLARFQLGRFYPVQLRTLLDNLADEYDARYTRRDALDLAEFLFHGYKLRGAKAVDFYNPLNSNLVHVIQHKRGIPISLVCIYILVGDRLGLTIEGCNFPQMFLAVASTGRRKVIVDCFSGGTVITDDTLIVSNAEFSRAEALNMRCKAPAIVARVLRNLIGAYRRAGDLSTVELMRTLLRTVETPPNHTGIHPLHSGTS